VGASVLRICGLAYGIFITLPHVQHGLDPSRPPVLVTWTCAPQASFMHCQICPCFSRILYTTLAL
jgi:hypothetical protein